MRTADAILTADIHLRDDQPVCRLDDFWEAQARKIAWLDDLQSKHNCPIIDAGDLFHKWKASHFLARWAILNLPDDFHSLWGNHNIPYHNMDLFEQSILGVLAASEKLEVLFDKVTGWRPALIHPFLWGTPLESLDKKYIRDGLRNIALAHTMTYTGRKPFPGCRDMGATALLKSMKGYDLIVTGHNHVPFVIELEGRLLVNPGSITRQTADQADHQPRVYLWYAKENRVEPVYVPIEKGVVSREHIECGKARDERLEAFVSRLNGDYEISLSFERNLEEFLSRNRVRSRVKHILQEALHDDAR